MTKHEKFADENPTDIKVRVGVPDDIHALMELALLGVEENAYSRADPMKLLQNMWAALILDHGITGLIGPVGGPLEGAVVLRIGTSWYGSDDDQIIEEKAIYVRDEFRSAKGGRAARLAEFSKNVADTLGLPMTIGVLSTDRTAAKIRLYRRMFGEPSGAYWLYNAKTGFSPL